MSKYNNVLNYINNNKRIFGEFAFNTFNEAVWHREYYSTEYSPLRPITMCQHVLLVNTQLNLRNAINRNQYLEVVSGLASLNPIDVYYKKSLNKLFSPENFFYTFLTQRENELKKLKLITSKAIFNLLNVPMGARNKSLETILGNVLKRMNYVRKRVRVKHEFFWGYFPIEQEIKKLSWINDVNTLNKENE